MRGAVVSDGVSAYGAWCAAALVPRDDVSRGVHVAAERPALVRPPGNATAPRPSRRRRDCVARVARVARVAGARDSPPGALRSRAPPTRLLASEGGRESWRTSCPTSWRRPSTAPWTTSTSARSRYGPPFVFARDSPLPAFGFGECFSSIDVGNCAIGDEIPFTDSSDAGGVKFRFRREPFFLYS